MSLGDYSKNVFVNGGPPALSAENLNKNENKTKELDTEAQRVALELIGKAPNNHASSNTTYGVASSANYGHAKASASTPLMDGVASVGTDNGEFARGTHRHPTDTSLVPKSRSITAGNGLTGGGDLTANRALALGTPGSITPSTTNNVTSTSHTHALDQFPVGSFYVQYPNAASNTDSTEFPVAYRPATLFGGTWTEQWSSESIGFITRGTFSNEDRVNGLQADAGQRITGSIAVRKMPGGAQGIPEQDGAFSLGAETATTGYARFGEANASAATYLNFDSGTSTGARVSDTHTRIRNRRIKVWKRTA